ncbi:MAG: cytidylate kinase family protein [Clostridia bacterium]
MSKKNIISISGELASGKGTVSKILMERLNYGIYRNGDYFRKLAQDMKMDITTFNIYVKDHPEIDRQVENSASEYAKTHENFIIDARLGWYAVPESFKVYLKVDIDVAAKRAYEDNLRKNSEKFDTIEEQKQDMQKRYQLENERYWNIYGIRKEDESNYDLVIDTTNLTPEQVADKIEKEYKEWLK